MRLPHRTLLACLTALLAACAGAPPPKPAPTPTPAVPLLIATPMDESAPAALEARLTPKDDSQVLLRFTVEPDGRVQGTQVQMSKLPDDTTAAVVGAFGALRFRPYQQDGKPVARDFLFPLFFGPNAVSERTRFLCLHEQERYQPQSRCEIVTTGGWRVYRVTPAYPVTEYAQHVSGAVTLGFDLDASGVPSNVKVLKSTPPGVFDTAAEVALQQWFFETQDGSPAPGTQHMNATVNFTPPAGGK